mmetsp:Transcript_23409/g.23044  ORF Transcript_23409/g.23044 Transcript_23409/m.23044 type:complete len:374 (-) Transcript_23409:26-1147(-)|eukprot:CAMPEP_0170544606 /NCGR_PEP_ID=MMETSP0211-20121228/3300_1 /TAXON_ID=311385 /ORGANISM="Pseudokeronopsis sp., Strain OXSARD2" /LENGTH=373 /DNA_ID=CAMNT_0010848291 /DNA_START=1204 /DNA_END=2325 /DNA_ORIENTATION=+
MILSLIVILIGWALIIILSIYANLITAELSKYSSFLGTWMPTLIVTLINFIIPKVLSLLTELEQWEYASLAIKYDVWRTYLASQLNNIVYALIYIEVLIDIPLILSDTIVSYDEANEDSIKYPCKEDMVSTAFVQLLLSEFALRYVYYYYWYFHYRVKARLRKEKNWKMPFETSDELVWILGQQSIIWYNLIFFPYMAVLAPIWMYGNYRFIEWRLRKWKVQPEESTNDESLGYFIMAFMNFTFLIQVGTMGFIIFYPMNHDYFLDDSSKFCGPFGKNSVDRVNWYDSIYDSIADTSSGDAFYEYGVQNKFIFMFLILMLAMNTFWLYKKIKIFYAYKDHKYNEVENIINGLTLRYIGLQKKDRFLREHRKLD